MGNAKGTPETAINSLLAPLNVDKTGANFKSLPQYLQSNIEKNITISDDFKDAIRNGNPYNMNEEWTAGFKGVKDKRKVIFTYEDGKINYTVKKGNKVLLKTTNKEQLANKVAQFYNELLSKR